MCVVPIVAGVVASSSQNQLRDDVEKLKGMLEAKVEVASSEISDEVTIEEGIADDIVDELAILINSKTGDNL